MESRDFARLARDVERGHRFAFRLNPDLAMDDIGLLLRMHHRGEIRLRRDSKADLGLADVHRAWVGKREGKDHVVVFFKKGPRFSMDTLFSVIERIPAIQKVVSIAI